LRLCRDHAVADDQCDLLALLITELVAVAVSHGAAPVEVSATLTGTAATGVAAGCRRVCAQVVHPQSPVSSSPDSSAH